VNRQEPFGRLDLHDNQTVNDHVHAEARIEAQVAIKYG
jgi:hypothetical protein